MSGKRGATSDLNHENWDNEEEKEVAGTFQRAMPDEIERRVIKVATRRKMPGVETLVTTIQNNANAFDQLGGPTGTIPKSTLFSFLNQPSATSANVPKSFSFLTKDQATTGNDKNLALFSFLSEPQKEVPLTDKDVNNDNLYNNNANSCAITSISTMAKTLQSSTQNVSRLESTKKLSTVPNIQPLTVSKIPSETLCTDLPTKATISESNSAAACNNVLGQKGKPSSAIEEDGANRPMASIPKAADNVSKSGRSEAFLKGMREINEDFVTWVGNHLEKLPTVILTRCFKDYINHVQTLFDEEKKLTLTNEQRQLLEKQERVLNELIVQKPFSESHSEADDDNFTDSDSEDEQSS